MNDSSKEPRTHCGLCGVAITGSWSDHVSTIEHQKALADPKKVEATYTEHFRQHALAGMPHRERAANAEHLLEAFQHMLNMEGCEYPAEWNSVPAIYQEDFKTWCQEYKQQEWGDIWHRGWQNYHLEYLRSLLDGYFQGRQFEKV